MRCRKARQLILLYLAPHASGLNTEDRRALQAHMAVCEPCRRDCEESQEAIALVRRYWQVSEDTQALLQQARPLRVTGGLNKFIWLRAGLRRTTAGTIAAAACLVLAVLGWWVISGPQAPLAQPESQVASSGGGMGLAVESVDDGARMSPGATIQTFAGETKSLVLNGKHHLVMNAGTRLSIEPLVEEGRTGCLVKLALGEVYVHVEHDGHPFLVQTVHGRAVITGTTFDVKVTEAGTTLVVVEGSVCFRSEGGAVQVIAGQQSMLAAASVSPSTPAACDAIALTSWAHSANQGWQMAQNLHPDDFLLDDLPMALSPWTQIQTDLDRVDYAQWVEQKRGWFKQQFPWIFELKEALDREGTETDYPALLLRSGDLWRFAYPQTGLGRQVEPDPNGPPRVALHYGRNEAWLQQQALSSLRITGDKRSATGPEAFERWARAVQAQADLCPPKADSGVLLDTATACLYLANTRTLALLALRQEPDGTRPQVKDAILGFLQEELRTLARCVELSYGLDWAKPNTGTCDNLDQINLLLSEIRKAGELEKRIREHETHLGR